MDESQAALPLNPPAPAATLAAPDRSLPRWFAAMQVLLVSSIPTQVVAVAIVWLGTEVPMVDRQSEPTLEFVAIVSFIDTALVAMLIRIFLSLSGETSDSVFIGRRSVKGEFLRGLALMPVVFLAVTGIVVGIRAVAPWMHNVETNPFEQYMNTPIEAGVFMLVVVLAGGVREELQRAFILHRFEQRLGGLKVGLPLFSLAFGALHLPQGFDAATAVCLLGLFWGVMYIRRRSVILPMVNHASFDVAQVGQVLLAKILGA